MKLFKILVKKKRDLKVVPIDQKLRLVTLVQGPKRLKVIQASALLGINYQTAKSILRRYKLRGHRYF